MSWFLGITHGHFDPSVALVRDGRVVAYSEEERHTREKHAPYRYPLLALEECLARAGIELGDVEALGVNWNLPAYSDGTMAAFYEGLRRQYNVDETTIAWQQNSLRVFQQEAFLRAHQKAWKKRFGSDRFPRVHPIAHHRVHAFQAALQSPFERSLTVTIDGSGDEDCTVLWRHEGTELTRLRSFTIPGSLGWVYAAITEYLGFEAYDGEYKLMGLAALGREDSDLAAKMERLWSWEGATYRVDPYLLHYGRHSHSERYTDALVEVLGREPRKRGEELDQWHADVALATQRALEKIAEGLVRWGLRETGFSDVCLGGGVALNVKMNQRILEMPEVSRVFAHPLCSDAGAAAGAALAACFDLTGCPPEKLETVALGFSETPAEIQQQLDTAKVPYERPERLSETIAEELARGKLVAWFQGRMEAGPRALGQRSILADPRHASARDRVNAAVKYREAWRPFGPSMTWESAPRYFDEPCDSPFMTLSLAANERMKKEAPAVVHGDGSCRVQFVHRETLPGYHSLLSAFEQLTGTPILLNTSLNVKGEPMARTFMDALRIFWSTGLDVLVAEDLVVKKP